MAKAVVDPAELRQFANDLRRFNQDLDNHMRILQTRMQTLAELERSGANQIHGRIRRSPPFARSVSRSIRSARALPVAEGRAH